MPTEHPNIALLESATRGFDHLFANDIVSARAHFTGHDDPFHLMGLGVCAFLEAALGMESGLMVEASRCLALSEAGARKKMKASQVNSHSRFPAGIEWEILNADAVVLLGLTHALSESYMGYLQCMYSLNSAHSKFTKLFKTVFPVGLNAYLTTSTSPNASTPSLATPASTVSTNVSRKTSSTSMTTSSSQSVVTTTSAFSSVTITAPAPVSRPSMLGRWFGSSPATSSSHLTADQKGSIHADDGPIEEFIVAGTAFGFGLFNLVFSLLPKGVQNLVGFLGFKHDRKLGLQALSVSAAKKDVHGVYASLVLMTYHGVVLLLSGYQADEEHTLKQYKAIVDNVEGRYPEGVLWILNRAKILRMSHDPDGAIRVLQGGLKPERPHSFAQGDMLLMFELAWTLLAQRRYKEAADTFIRVTELNSWSHATYYFIAAGCHVSLKDLKTAQKLFDIIPGLIDKKKVAGKDLPTEVFIKKKLAFLREKQVRRGGVEAAFVESIGISPADEIAIFWNNHSRIDKSIAEAHISGWIKLTPTLGQPPAESASQLLDLDTPDELALRSLLIGINQRTIGLYEDSRSSLMRAYEYRSDVKVSTWIAGVAMFELAVLDLKELEAAQRDDLVHSGKLDTPETSRDEKSAEPHKITDWNTAWKNVLLSATSKLDTALGLATSSTDFSSRLDGRIAMLKDEIATKRNMLNILPES